jgi:flagellar basal body rod protein FlgG
LKLDRNPSDITITKDGNIFSDDGNLVGALALREFDDPDTLTQRSGNRLLPADDPGQPALMTRVYQGYLEGPNISAPVLMAQLNQASTDYKQSATMMRTTIRSYQDLTPQLLVAS